MPKDISADIVTVTPETVAEWLVGGEVVLVDVRETREYDLEHIAGALLLPLSSFEAEVFPVLTGKPVVLHCAIGKRSEAAAKMLLKAGHARVAHMAGGLTAWKAAGLPVEEEISEPAPSEAATPTFLCPTPGAVLRDEFLTPNGIATGTLASAIGVTETSLARLIAGELAVDAELSLRLSRFFSTAADFWLHLQTDHDIERARHAIGEQLRAEIRPRAA